MIKIIYFDYHQVLDRRGYRGLLDAILTAAKQPNSAVEMLEPYAYAYAAGKVQPVEFWNSIERDYGLAAAAAGKKYYLHVDPIREMWELINTLKEKYQVGLCTECAIDKKEVLKHAYDLPDFFDQLFFSCDIGLTKKDMEFYRLLLQNGMYQPNECILVDADEHNIAMAKTLWIEAIQFTNPENLKKQLASIQ